MGYARGSHGGFDGGFGGFGHPQNSTNLIADLAPASGNIGQGELRYTAGTNRTTLRGGVTLPIGGTSGLTDANAAAGATVTLTLPNMSCTLQPLDIRFGYSQSGSPATESIDFAIRGHLDSTTNTTTFRIGSCTNNAGVTSSSGSSVNSTNNTLPEIVSGDTATVTISAQGSSTPIYTLTGTFK